MVIFYKKWKKYNEIQLTKKNKMDLNNRKMTNHPHPPLNLNNKSKYTQRCQDIENHLEDAGQPSSRHMTKWSLYQEPLGRCWAAFMQTHDQMKFVSRTTWKMLGILHPDVWPNEVYTKNFKGRTFRCNLFNSAGNRTLTTWRKFAPQKNMSTRHCNTVL